jgi:hypothetical protein
MDTDLEACFLVHRLDGSVMKFIEHKTGLYYHDVGRHSPNLSSNDQEAYLFLNTVAGNKATYTQREIEGADKARALYRKLVRPSEQEFSNILQNGLIRNCPLTADDAKRALHIYGPDIKTLQGKTVKRQNGGIPDYRPIRIPAPIIAKYNTIRLFMDIFWVNGSPYFHTISQHIKFRTVAAINNRQKRTLLMEARAAIHLYEARGFTISRVEADREYACIQNDLLPTPLNVADADDHVAEVERSIRTIKERTRCSVQGLPFRRIPKMMMRAIIENAHKALNQFPAKNGVSDVMSPLTIMTGQPSPDYHDLKIEFGTYAQVYEPNDPTNTNRTRTTGAIALSPVGNAQAGYYFMSLVTGKRLSRQQWDEIPMPDGVIAAVEAMAEAGNQPIMKHGDPVFEWSPGITIVDDDAADPPIDIEEEHEEVDNAEAEAEYNNAAAEAEHNDDVNDAEAEAEHEEIDFEEGDEDDDVVYDADNTQEDPDDDVFVVETVHEEDNDGVGHEDLPELAPEPAHAQAEHGHDLRPNRERSYGPRIDHSMDNPGSSQRYGTQFVQQGEMDGPSLRDAVIDMNDNGSEQKVHEYITGFIFTQMTAKAGIKKHGQVAIDALYQEFLQLHDLEVFEAQDVRNLTKHQKRAALRAINVIKEKRCGKIKGRTV